MTKHEDIPYIQHIADAIRDIESFTENLNKSEFIKDNLRQSAVIRQLEVIGEATKNISAKFKKKYQQIEWKDIAGTRDKIIHHYFGINLDIIWDIIKKDIPKLKKQINVVLEIELKQSYNRTNK